MSLKGANTYYLGGKQGAKIYLLATSVSSLLVFLSNKDCQYFSLVKSIKIRTTKIRTSYQIEQADKRDNCQRNEQQAKMSGRICPEINNLISTSLTHPLKENELKEATCEKCQQCPEFVNETCSSFILVSVQFAEEYS